MDCDVCAESPILAAAWTFRFMASVKKIVLIEFTPAQMFDLLTVARTIPSSSPGAEERASSRDERTTVATLHINHHGIRNHFTTGNLKERPAGWNSPAQKTLKHRRHLARFVALGDSAYKVEFGLLLRVREQTAGEGPGPVFSHIANTFVDSFVKRAGRSESEMNAVAETINVEVVYALPERQEPLIRFAASPGGATVHRRSDHPVCFEIPPTLTL